MNEPVVFQVGTEFQSYADFLKRYQEYEAQEYCNFRVESSKTLSSTPGAIQQDIDNFHYKYAKFVCKFYGNPRKTVAAEHRVRETATYRQNCQSCFSIGYREGANGGVLCILKLNANHSHARSENLYKTMPKQRQTLIQSCDSYLNKVVDVRANIQMLQAQISTEDSVVKRKDLYNYRAKKNRSENDQPIDSNDLTQMVNEMCSVQGATVKVYHNDAQELEAVYFQDERMKTYFDRYPDFLCFDGTYCLNDK